MHVARIVRLKLFPGPMNSQVEQRLREQLPELYRLVFYPSGSLAIRTSACLEVTADCSSTKFKKSSLRATYYATDQYMHTMYGTELNDHRAASELDTL